MSSSNRQEEDNFIFEPDRAELATQHNSLI